MALSLCAIAQTQIQYTYDAAGNLIQAVRIFKPDLSVSSLSVTSISQHAGGGYDIAASFTITNNGNGPAVASWYDRGYLSTSATLHDTDQVLGGANNQATNLASGASYTASITFTAAASTPAGAAYLIVKADGGASTSGQYAPTGANYVDESDETNNTRAVAITLPAQQPDLIVTTASVGTITVNQNGSYSLPTTYTVTNAGGVTAAPSWYDLAYLSSNATLDNADTNVTGFSSHGTSVAVNGTYTNTVTFTTPTSTASGAYTLFVKTDGHGTSVGGTNTDSGNVAEANEQNNAYGISLSLPVKPDLQVSTASVGTVAVNQNGTYSIPISYTITNAGGAAAQPSWYDLGYLSSDATLDNSDINLGGFSSHGSALAAGGSYSSTTTFTASTSVAAGSFTIFLKTDGHGATVGGSNTDTGNVLESNDTNNAYSLPITLPARPDLQVTSASVGTIVKNADGSYSIPLTYTVTNAGGSAAQPSWYDLAYLSSDATLDNADKNLSAFGSRGSALAAGASYTTTTTFKTTTTTTAGTYTLFFKTDAHGATVGVGTNTDGGNLFESSETNNTYSTTVTLP